MPVIEEVQQLFRGKFGFARTDWGFMGWGCWHTHTLRLKVCHGVEEWAGSVGGGGNGFTLTAEHMEGCRFPRDSILNVYLRCYRWRSQRQKILYKAFWKAQLIFHQICIYTRKQTKKEVCHLNPPCSLSLTQTQSGSILYFWSVLHSLTQVFPLIASSTSLILALFSYFLFLSKPNRLNHL